MQLRPLSQKRFYPNVPAHQSGEQVTSIRLNPAKPVNQFSILNFQFPIPLVPQRVLLPERPSSHRSPVSCRRLLCRKPAACFETAIQANSGSIAAFKVLDLCAAPGGKSTLIQSLLNKDSFWSAMKWSNQWFPYWQKNITKWGLPMVVTNNDPKDFQRLENFLMIVVDAPCSGSGLFRKSGCGEQMDENNVQLLQPAAGNAYWLGMAGT